MSSISQASPVLLGLNFVVSPKTTTTSCLKTPPQTTPRNSHIKPFEPSSTQRAKSRAKFDAKRVENARKRREEEIQNRTKVVEKMYGELDVLREEI